VQATAVLLLLFTGLMLNGKAAAGDGGSDGSSSGGVRAKTGLDIIDELPSKHSNNSKRTTTHAHAHALSTHQHQHRNRNQTNTTNSTEQPPKVSGYTYNETRSLQMVQLSGAAYCSGVLGKGVENWDCEVCKKFPGTKATIVSDAGPGLMATNANGFVAFVATDGPHGSIVVSFSGTNPTSLQNWMVNLNFALVDPIEYISAGCEACKVDRGFLTAYLSVRSQVREAVRFYTDAHPLAPIWITGHSLGGALAVHASVDLTIAGYKLQGVYTFGQPRIANTKFSAWYREHIASSFEHFRVTHNRDPVPHLPPDLPLSRMKMIPTAFLGVGDFSHVPVEVFYPGDSGGNFVVCDGSGEDQQCSDSHVLDLQVADHMYYVGFAFAKNTIGCKL